MPRGGRSCFSDHFFTSLARFPGIQESVNYVAAPYHPEQSGTIQGYPTSLLLRFLDQTNKTQKYRTIETLESEKHYCTSNTESS